MISNGHTFDAVLGYTLAQFNAFLAACVEREKVLHKQYCIAQRIAQCEAKAFDEYVRRL